MFFLAPSYTKNSISKWISHYFSLSFLVRETSLSCYTSTTVNIIISICLNHKWTRFVCLASCSFFLIVGTFFLVRFKIKSYTMVPLYSMHLFYLPQNANKPWTTKKVFYLRNSILVCHRFDAVKRKFRFFLLVLHNLFHHAIRLDIKIGINNNIVLSFRLISVHTSFLYCSCKLS